MSNGTTQTYNGPKRVAIFGAGVTGLTAAHELVERGFEVEVFERDEPSLLESPPGGPEEVPCAIGGMARTQWSRAERPDPYHGTTSMRSTQRLKLELERELARVRVSFQQQQEQFDPAPLADVYRIMTALAPDYGQVTIQVRGYLDVYEWQLEQANPQPGQPSLALRRASRVVAALHNLGIPNDQMIPLGLGVRGSTDFTIPDEQRRVVTFDIVQDYIPGEHGFRFFPTFYRNLRDTLKRTPVPVEDTEPYVETFRTVFDNLVPAPSQAIFMYPPRPAYILPRRPGASVQELFDSLVEALQASGFTFRDINRWLLVLFKYLTSSPARRHEYESISWSEFVRIEQFSPQFQKYLVATPQALLAFAPDECDARTYGNITVQLLRDQLMQGEVVDGVLNGATSLVWFDPWRRYLQSQGVIFRRGTLDRFEVAGNRAFPVVKNPDDTTSVIVSDYYVVALELAALKGAVLANSPAVVAHSRDAKKIVDLELGADGVSKPKGAMQHLSGIQFYFSTPLDVLRGHAMYADSEWGLSSISQPQFWVRKRGWWDGYRSVLTVGIGDWNREVPEVDACSAVHGKNAWECTRDQIAHEIWRQIKKSIIPREYYVCDEIRPHPLIAEPTLYHLDEGILLSRSGTPIGNKTRMLMNLPGMQVKRPGRLHQDGYQTWFDNTLVFAGTYMRTHTRLTTMEAANESARHAVNAILHTSGFRGDRCRIAQPEEHELSDLKYFVDLDAELHNQGLPHVVDIVAPDELPKEWLKGMLTLTGLRAFLGLR